MKRHPLARITVVAAAIALLVSGCGDSSAEDGTASIDASDGPSGAPIVIGNIGSYTGAQGSTIGSGKDGIEAWAASVNAAGGIDGRPIKLIVKDDTQNPTTALAQVKELINEGVVAIVSDQSSVDAQWAPLAAAAKIPVVGGFGFNLTFATNPNFYASGTNVFALTFASQVNAKAAGPRFAALYCAEAPQCQILVKLEEALSKASGVEVPLVAPVSATSPDYTAICQSIKDADVQSYATASGVSVVTRVAEACAQQGVTATQQILGELEREWLTNPAFEGAVAASATFPSFDSSVPATQAFQAAMEAHGAAATANASEAWVAGKLFEAAVGAIPAGEEITSASVKDGLYSLKDETLDGLTPPLTYTPGKPLLVNCWFTSGITDGELVAPKGLETECAPDELIEGIVKAMAPS